MMHAPPSEALALATAVGRDVAAEPFFAVAATVQGPLAGARVELIVASTPSAAPAWEEAEPCRALHSYLWPPSFQCVFWHSTEQYHTCENARKVAVAVEHINSAGSSSTQTGCPAMRAECNAVHPSHKKNCMDKVRLFQFIHSAPTCLHLPHRFWPSSPQPLRAQHTRCFPSPSPAAPPPLARARAPLALSPSPCCGIVEIYAIGATIEHAELP